MLHVTSLVFDGSKTAGKALDTLQDETPEARFLVDDVAVISRGKHGMVRVNSTWAESDDMATASAGFGLSRSLGLRAGLSFTLSRLCPPRLHLLAGCLGERLRRGLGHPISDLRSVFPGVALENLLPEELTANRWIPVLDCRLHGEDGRGRRQHSVRQLLERRDVGDPDRPSVRPGDQLVIARVDLEIVNRAVGSPFMNLDHDPPRLVDT